MLDRKCFYGQRLARAEALVVGRDARGPSEKGINL